MSRVAKNPIVLPPGVEVRVSGREVVLKGGKGTLSANICPGSEVVIDGNVLTVRTAEGSETSAFAGTTRATIANMVTGVSQGYERKLTMVGVGYRAQAKGATLSLSLGYSHPIEYDVPAGVSIETPTQTEIVVRGCDKQQVGQVAAKIRSYRPPEPYKGKGVRYSDEEIVRKEAKKK